MSSKEAPLIFGLVCKHWRSVSHDTPGLWTSIHIVVSQPDPSLAVIENETRAANRNAAVKRWLDRAKSSPISFSLYELGVFDGKSLTQDPCVSLFEVLAYYSTTWRKVELTCGSSLPFFMDLYRDNLPLLQSISAKALSPRSVKAINNAGILSAPNLHTVRLSDVPYRAFTKAADHWTELTDLVFDIIIPASTALFLLSSCPSLVRTTMRISGREDRDHPEVVASFLEEFSLTESGIVQQFYKVVKAPALKKFRYNRTADPKTQALPVTEFLASCHVLESLIINPARLEHAHIATALKVTPSIHTLTFESKNNIDILLVCNPVDGSIQQSQPSVDDTVMKTLITQRGSALCPNLRTFSCEKNTMSDNVLLQFIRSRTGTRNEKLAARLKSVTVTKFYRPSTIDIMGYLKEEIADGLEVSLRYSLMSPVTPKAGMPWHKVMSIYTGSAESG